MQNRTYGCPPKLEGKELDQMPWMAKGLQLHGHGAGPEAGLNKPVPLCVPQWSHTGEHGLTCAGPRPVLLVCHPSLPCCHQAEPLPCGICALFPCIHMTGKIYVSAAHGYSSKVSYVTVHFMALVLLGNLVRMQLLYNSWILTADFDMCAQNDLVVI